MHLWCNTNRGLIERVTLKCFEIFWYFESCFFLSSQRRQVRRPKRNVTWQRSRLEMRRVSFSPSRLSSPPRMLRAHQITFTKVTSPPNRAPSTASSPRGTRTTVISHRCYDITIFWHVRWRGNWFWQRNWKRKMGLLRLVRRRFNTKWPFHPSANCSPPPLTLVRSRWL